MSELDEVDIAVVARLSGDDWQLDELPDRALADAAALVREVDRQAAPGRHDAVLALVSVGEDFALIARGGVGGRPARLAVSDVTAALEWQLAASVLDHLGVDRPQDDDEPEPAGDLALLGDLELSRADLAALVDDEEHPDDLLLAVADELGFLDELEDLLEDDDSDDGDDRDDGDDSDDEDDGDDELDELEDDDPLELDDDPFDAFGADEDDELAEDAPVTAHGRSRSAAEDG